MISAPGQEVVVVSQPLVDDIIVIDRIEYDGPAWMVIHNDINGEPGEIVGIERLFPGVTESLVVKLDLSLVTDTMYAMLHQDLGLVGKWELTKDFPVTVNGSVLAPPFMVTERLSSGIASVEVSSGGVIAHDVISGGPGWLVLEWNTSILEQVWVDHGRTSEVLVPYADSVPEGAYLRLYEDRGIIGVFDSETDLPTEHMIEVQVIKTITSVLDSDYTASTDISPFPIWTMIGLPIIILRRFHHRV